MYRQTLKSLVIFLFLMVLGASLNAVFDPAVTHANNDSGIPAGKPEATIDLASASGVDLVKGNWRYSDTKIVEVEFRGPGPDKQPTGAPVKTYDYTPHAGGVNFDDSKWEVISATSLDQRRGNGRLGFSW